MLGKYALLRSCGTDFHQKFLIYLDMNVSSVEEFCCLSFLNAPTCNEIPMEYPVPNMFLKIL